MKPAIRPRIDDEDEFLAELTDIAYRALLRQGLRRSFVDVELELWSEIRQTLGSSWGIGEQFERTPQAAVLSLGSA